jgi:hypothetical protein
MKFLPFMALFILPNVYGNEMEITPNALEDGFKLNPKLEKSVGSEYESKMLPNKKKVFKKIDDRKYKISMDKETSQSLDVYQLKIEKMGEKVEKTEQVVEFDKSSPGKMKQVHKCMSRSKGGCQSYSRKLCKKLIGQERELDQKIASEGERKAIDDFKETYRSENAYEFNSAHLAKLKAMNDQSVAEVGEKPSAPEMKEKLKPIYPAPSVSFDVEKIKTDIRYCKKIDNDWKEESDTPTPSQSSGNNSSAQ